MISSYPLFTSEFNGTLLTTPPSIYFFPLILSFLNPIRYALASRKSSSVPSGISSMLKSSSLNSDTENVSRQNSLPQFRIASSSTVSWISLRKGVTSTPPSFSILRPSFRNSFIVVSFRNRRSIHSSSTSMTVEKVISFQISSAFPTSPIQIRAPFNAPTEVPATALILTPASARAFHAPI